MAFKPRKYDSGKSVRRPMSSGASFTKGQLAKMDGGYLSDAAAGDNEVEYVVLETVADATSSDGGTFAKVIRIDDVTEFEALVSTTPVQATHVGNDYDLTDKNTVNLGATTDKVFHIERILDASNNLVAGHFNKPAIA